MFREAPSTYYELHFYYINNAIYMITLQLNAIYELVAKERT